MVEEGLPLLRLSAAQPERFVTVRGGRSAPAPVRDRVAHATSVLAQIDATDAQIVERRSTEEGPPRASLIAASGPGLDAPKVARQFTTGASGVEVVLADDGRLVVRADHDLSGLRAKAEAYASQDTIHGNPKFRELIERIDRVELATIADLSLGEIDDDVDDGARLWIEIWTTRGPEGTGSTPGSTRRAIVSFAALTTEGVDAVPVFHGPERDVWVVLATGSSLKSLPGLLPQAAEVHLAPTIFPVVMAEAQDDFGQIADVHQPPDDAPVIAVHDTGVDSVHPYISPVLLGASSVVPGEEGTLDADGHGTQMAGVAVYSSLAGDAAAGTLHADAWLVAMRLLESTTDKGGDPDRGAMWADRTVASVETAEDLAEDATVIHNLSIGADTEVNGRIDRTSWSVATDVLGWNDGAGRIIVVAGGNHDAIVDRGDYPTVNLGPPFLQQPGQGWNVITVGGWTGKDTLTAVDVRDGYGLPLAHAGELSPHSRTSLGGSRPIKPDIVMEAGNTTPDGSMDYPEAQGLSTLTLRSSAGGGTALFRRTWKTSPAAAAASNALARVAAVHPELRAATWRALLVHTARWPAAAIAQFPDRRDLLRSFGYGVPRVDRATSSASNRPVMIYEGALRPSHHDGSKPARQADFVEIPLPEDELDELGASTVELTVTLSYFVEPTDNLTRRAYAGGRLRWDLQGPTETEQAFRSRINRLIRDQGVARGSGSYAWTVGSDTRSRGTLQHDHVAISAAAVSGSRLLAVYPVLGWWEDSKSHQERLLPYSVVVSVDLGDADVDIFSVTAAALIELPGVDVSV